MKNSLSNWSLLDSGSRWIRNTLARRADEAALQDSGELQRIASDLNLSVSELHTLCARDGGSMNLLQKRMSQLHLDKSEIKRAHPAVVRDLEKVCALCTSDAKCSRDFDRNTDPRGWSEYCPNAATLQELQREAARSI
jgi:AraC-like DNA-binding protein